MATTLAHESLTAPLPLEQYAYAFDDLFRTRLQRRRFREDLAGLLVPRDRNKTLTSPVGAEPITQAQTAPVPQLQCFLTESDWDAEAMARRQIDRLCAEPLTASHPDGALVIDETGVRKDGTPTAHPALQALLDAVTSGQPLSVFNKVLISSTGHAWNQARWRIDASTGAAARSLRRCGVSRRL